MKDSGMTHEELLKWAAQEAQTRVKELNGVKTTEGLKRAQELARQRRQTVHLSANEVVALISETIRRRKAGH